MTMTAVWPATGSSTGGDGMTLTEPAEVDALVGRLKEPTAGPATVWHEGRDPADDDTGELDHDVCAAVVDGYGYLAYIDIDHDYAVLHGDPASPAVHSEDVEFPAGSGVSPEVLAGALREFLTTAARPTSVEWVPAEW